MARELRATVEAVIRLTPTIVEVVVHAPAAARAFRPGQFYRLQNYEPLARRVNGTTLAMEGPRSPARGWIGNAGWCRRSSSKWEARRTFARTCVPASRSC